MFRITQFIFFTISSTLLGQTTISFDDQGYTNNQNLNNFSIVSGAKTFNFSSSSIAPGFQYQTGAGFCGAVGSGFVEVTNHITICNPI